MKEILLKILEIKEEDIPEFLDIRMHENDYKYITIMTNSGGSDRTKYYEENEELRLHPRNVGDEDDPSNANMAIFTFEVDSPTILEALKIGNRVILNSLLDVRDSEISGSYRFQKMQRKLAEADRRLDEIESIGQDIET